MTDDFRTIPFDALALERAAAAGLRLGLVDEASFAAWLRADSRGFHDSAPTPEESERKARELSYRRTVGVWDASIVDPDVPVATVASWPAELTVPGETSVTAWAISSVTVSPTRRRKGIARTMLEGELATASALGIPLAMLTVSEATIYGRYGFAPAASSAWWSIDTSKARWAGPESSGRVSFISADRLLAEGPAIFERARRGTAGDVERWAALWPELVKKHEPDEAKKLRIVRHDDASGVAQGFAIYSLRVETIPARRRILEVEHLVSVTDDAYAGLWRFLLEQDLVAEVTAPLRSVDEPLVWQLTDRRAIRKTDERDHLWVRILDVPRALAARRYSAPGRVVVEVDDPLGYASGRFLIEIDADGAATVEPTTEAPHLALSVNELGALYLGGVSATELHRAGRVREVERGAVAAFDSSFRTDVAPWLSIWF